MSKSRRASYFKLAGWVAAVGLFLVALCFFPLTEFIDLIAALQQSVMQWGVWSGICYPLLFALCNILLLPGGILCVGAGFFFGLWWGFVIVLLGNAIAAAFAFAFSRRVRQHWFRRKFSQNPLLRALEPAVEREGWKIILLSQLHPLFPTSLINYLYGLTRIRFGTYMLWTSIGRAPGLFLYTYLGTLGQYGLNVARGKTHPRAMEYWIWGGAFITTTLLFVVLSRIAVKAIHKAQAASSGGTGKGQRIGDRAWQSASL
jgi:uncharacterized membrane protein YdjX (TVP38/TMEM64 family)